MDLRSPLVSTTHNEGSYKNKDTNVPFLLELEDFLWL